MKIKHKYFVIYLLFLLLTFLFALPTKNNKQSVTLFIDDTKYEDVIIEVSKKYGVDYRLVKAIIYYESKFNSETVGKAGEIGLMQIIRSQSVTDWANAHKCKIPSEKELFEIKLNIEIGVWYLARALARYQSYKSVEELALATYNAGPSRAEKWKPEDVDGDFLENIDIPSTKNYIIKIIKKYNDYCAIEIDEK